MKFFLSLMFICFTTLLSGAVLKMEAYGTTNTKIFTLSKNRIYIALSNKGIVTHDIGVRGVSECEGIIEIIDGITTTNLMCKYIEENGDESFSQFKATTQPNSNNRFIQIFTILEGTGRWKELIGQKCIGATSTIRQKDLGDGHNEAQFMWAGKCEVPDSILERVKNYKKIQ